MVDLPQAPGLVIGFVELHDWLLPRCAIASATARSWWVSPRLRRACVSSVVKLPVG